MVEAIITAKIGYNMGRIGLRGQQQQWKRKQGILQDFYYSTLGDSEVRGGEY